MRKVILILILVLIVYAYWPTIRKNIPSEVINKACTLVPSFCPDISSSATPTNPQTASSTPEPSPEASSAVTVTLKVGETKIINDALMIQILSVEKDSRCATDVQCIWAGNVSFFVNLKGSNNKEKSVTIISDAAYIFDGHTITVQEIQPSKISTKTLKTKDYQVTFHITE